MSSFSMDRKERAGRKAWAIAHGLECDIGYYLTVEPLVRRTFVCITDKEEADILLALRALVLLGITAEREAK